MTATRAWWCLLLMLVPLTARAQRRETSYVGVSPHATKVDERRVVTCELSVWQGSTRVYRDSVHVVVDDFPSTLKLALKAAGSLSLELRSVSTGADQQSLLVATAQGHKVLVESARVESGTALAVGSLTARVRVTEVRRQPGVVAVPRADGSRTYRDQPAPSCRCVEAKNVESCCMQSVFCSACSGAGCDDCEAIRGR